MLRLPHFTVLLIVSCLAGSCTLLIRDPEKAYQKGVELTKERKPEKAYKYFLAATKKAPDNAIYHWAAAQTTRNQNAAFIHTEMAWKSGLKTVPVLSALIRLSLFTDRDQRIRQVLALYQELPDSVRTPTLKAELFSQLGASDSALTIWKGLYAAKPTSQLAFKIGRELNLKGDIAAARSFLETARKTKMLDGSGYVLLASIRAFEYDYEGVDDIFRETRKQGLYTNEVALEEAAFLFAGNKQEAAAKILAEYRKANPDQQDGLINHRARMNLAFLFAATKQMDSINTLIAEVPDSSPFKAGEVRFYKVLQESEKMEATALLQELEGIRKSIPANPFVELYTARAHLKNRQAAKAAEHYQRLPGIYLRSPGILTEYAMALSGSGKENEALVALSAMHRKRLFTRGSLELFRDLTFRKNLLEKSEHAQQLLEKLYGNDARVRWNGATLALRSGKIDSALTLLTELEKQFPDEHRFRTTRISALILKGAYDQALALCTSGSTPKELVLPLHAQILKKQGKDAQALQLIETAIQEKKSPQLSLLYAEMLMEMKRNEDAAKVYEELLSSRDQEKQEGPGTAAIYNNLAWAMLQAEKPDKKLVLKAAERAFELLPQSPNILDTYAEALITFGEYGKCVKILENAKATHQEPRLLFQLGLAYQKSKDMNKAIRSFKASTALMDSSAGTINMDISKAAVERHIDKLMEGTK